MMYNLEAFRWNKAHERTLRALTIDQDGPGTILHDFAAVLDYVKGRDLTVSKVCQQPALKLLPEMNALLRYPVEARLKRPAQEGETWTVVRARRISLGEAVFARLQAGLFSDLGKMMDLETEPPAVSCVLQPLFAPYLPQWQHNLELPTRVFREGRYTFRVSLARNLWRRIGIDARETLHKLATTILDAFDFDYDHLYEFSYRNELGTLESVYHPFIDEGPWATEVLVGDLPLAVGTIMTYTYDFGDWWEFEVKLEQVETSGDTPDKPEIVEERGESPEQYSGWEDHDEWWPAPLVDSWLLRQLAALRQVRAPDLLKEPHVGARVLA